MDTIYGIKQIEFKLKQIEKKNKSIAFVPTMGALHQGHLALVSEAKKQCDIVVVSIFINPKQFDNKDDLSSYPRSLDNDINLLLKSNVDYLFIPKQEDIYDEPILTNINVTSLTNQLCAKAREGHFAGVCLIIVKLFNIIKPHKVFFGLKDYQQYVIIKQLSKDLNFNIEIKAVETVREKTGLAISSRNQRLSQKEKTKIAPLIFKELNNLKNLINNNQSINKSIEETKERLLKNGFDKIDYLQILSDDLTPYDPSSKKQGRIFIAIFLGGVRLIDNIAL